MGLFDFWRKSSGVREQGKLIRSEYLESYGWYASMENGAHHGAPRRKHRSQPVLPYPITGLLDQIDWKESRVFVRMNVHSYRWLLHRARRISSSNVIMHRIGESDRSRFDSDPDFSVAALSAYMEERLAGFDLMIFDGPNKTEALPVILQGLSERGVIAMSDDLDNEDEYQETVLLLQQNGFHTLQLKGPGPHRQNLDGVVAYRSGNVLGL